jgi:hypothetical protein
VYFEISDDLRTRLLATPEWRDAKQVLAAARPEEVWKAVANVYRQASTLEMVMFHRPKAGDRVSDAHFELLRTAVRHTKETADRLEEAEALED